MRTVFFCAISIGVLLMSCAKLNNKAGGCPYDTINVFAAYRMIHHYGDSLVGKSASQIIRHFRIDNNCLANIVASSDEATFWTAADTVTNAPLIIIETKGGGKQHPSFYMMKGIPLCPPPTTPPCDTLINSGDFEQMFPLPPGY